MDRSSTLTGYVPAFVVQRAAADPAMLKAPAKDRQKSAVLFTDISGFTALSERLAGRGPAGAEELSQIARPAGELHSVRLPPRPRRTSCTGESASS